MSLAPGDRLGAYEILSLIGTGGMGQVYRAKDARLNRFVAIKVLTASSGDPARRQRFIQEAQAASSLNHPNIITIHDIVTEGDMQFMVMEYVNGKTLIEQIPRGGLRMPQALQFAVQIADALNAAHEAGIVHRDLKPANVMVTPNGLLKILDFGLAKMSVVTSAMDDATQSIAPLTVEGSIMGTLSYMSPEQAQGKKVDARSDIFSFGSLLYEMVTGVRAFEEAGLSTLLAVARDDPKPLSQVAPDVPPQFEQIINRCMRKQPDLRWQSMKDVHAALAALKQQFDSGITYQTIPVQTRPDVKKRSKVFVRAVLAVLIVYWVSKGLWTMTHPPAPVPAAAVVPATPVSSAPATLTNDSIIEMVNAKVPDSLIQSQIRASKTNFDLSTGQIIHLTQAGVSENVIEQMRDPLRALPAVAPAPAAPVLKTISVSVADGTPLSVALNEDIPADAEEGRLVSLVAEEDLVAGGAVVVAKGAHVTGLITQAAKKRHFVVGGSKLSFSLSQADAADGQKLNVRALPAHRAGVVQRPFDAGAGAGTKYIAYVDGDQTLSVRK